MRKGYSWLLSMHVLEGWCGTIGVHGGILQFNSGLSDYCFFYWDSWFQTREEASNRVLSAIKSDT